MYFSLLESPNSFALLKWARCGGVSGWFRQIILVKNGAVDFLVTKYKKLDGERCQKYVIYAENKPRSAIIAVMR